MVIKSLKLKNYRNYELLDMTFDSKTNILYGDNAQERPISLRHCICRVRQNPTEGQKTEI